MPSNSGDTSTILGIIRNDPELRRAVLMDPDHAGMSDERSRVATKWAIGFNATILLVLAAAEAILLLSVPMPPSGLDGFVPAWQLRLGSLGPLFLQLMAGVFVWNIATGLAYRREGRIARKLIDALVPDFDRGRLGLRSARVSRQPTPRTAPHSTRDRR